VQDRDHLPTRSLQGCSRIVEVKKNDTPRNISNLSNHREHLFISGGTDPRSHKEHIFILEWNREEKGP
jgi:hypothetical protein